MRKANCVNLEDFAYIKQIICQECGSSDFHYKNVEFKELKINTEVEEMHPATGIKNAGMETKWFKDLYSNI
jgi:hypothetical protein